MRFPPEVYQRAQELFNAIPRPPAEQIAERLLAEQATGSLRVDPGAVPKAKTVRDWIERGWIFLREQDAPWSLGDEDGNDIAVVLLVARWLNDGGWPPFLWPTKGVAKWITRIARAYPDLADHPGMLFRVAQQANGPVEHIGHVARFLAYTPWRDQGKALNEASKTEAVDTAVGLVGGSKFLDQVTDLDPKLRWFISR